MTAVIFEILGALGLFYVGILHPAWQTNPVLSDEKGRVVIGLLIIALVGGYFYYQASNDNKNIEIEKWHFVIAINTQESYCTYLKDYPEGIFSHEAKQKCNPTKISSPVILPTAQQFIKPEMIRITAGCFQMGSPDGEYGRKEDERQHKVCIEKDFEIGKYEVTQAQWMAIMGSNPSHFKGDNLPVEQVNYADIQQFVVRLNTQTGKNYRLPTEAEWEYAERAKSTTPFYSGNVITDEYANFNKIVGRTISVGSKYANSWGLHDMAGNVREWTCSAYIENYDGNETRCTDNVDTNTKLVLRGSAWITDPSNSRSANRFDSLSGNYYNYVGFRLAV